MRVKSVPMILALGEHSATVRGVADAIRCAVDDRRVMVGDALPSSRDLARQLAVARNTVLQAIALLVEAQVLRTEPGVGTFVIAQHDGPRRIQQPLEGSFRLSDWASNLPIDPRVLDSAPARYDFRPGLPDLATIPFDDWRRSAVRKLKTLRVRIGCYGEPQGDPELRIEIARYLARSRGVICQADDVVITSGAQQAFDLIARVLIRPGDTVAFEEPGYRPAAQAFSAAGAKIHLVPVDEHGLDVTLLPDNAVFAYATPSHQYPLGVSLSRARGAALLAWATQHKAFVVEDDYDSEYHYGKSAGRALQASDATGRVLYVGTFSKTLMPGIRLGYLIVPENLRSVFIRAKWLVDRHSDNVSQSVLAEFMTSGLFGRHVTQMKSVYADRHACLSAYANALSDCGVHLLPSLAGLHVCVLLHPDHNEGSLIASAQAQAVAVYGLAPCYLGGSRRAGLILGFGNLPIADIQNAMTRLLCVLARRKENSS